MKQIPVKHPHYYVVPSERDNTLKCGKCGRVYPPELWHALPYIGTMRVPGTSEYPPTSLEMKNCPCGSTLSKEIKPCE